MLQRIAPRHFSDYELLDSGEFEKLERFGQYILRRPEPQALWDKGLPEKEWAAKAQASFVRKSEKDSENGNWTLKPGMAEQWQLGYNYKGMKLRFRMGLTSFKHVGLFPEQAENWDWIYDTLNDFGAAAQKPKVLNLFAYTGGASLAACAAGADVTHVDSVKQVLSWGRENMQLSGLDHIRWVLEDAFKFVQREARRGNTYQGIILDPPAYGRGPDGEKWHLEKSLNELLQGCASILAPSKSFLLINLYSMGLSPMITENLVQGHFKPKKLESGELFLPDPMGKNLPLGTFCRFIR